MAGRAVPRALAERLGADGSEGLSRMLESARAEWSDDVLTLAAERFERGLTAEISKLRVDIAGELSRVRVGFAEELAKIRVEVAGELSKLRTDLSAELSGTRREVSDLRQDLGGVRVDLLKWSFLFWIGQVAAVAGLLAFMLRSLP